jgi:hypothetical protein
VYPDHIADVGNMVSGWLFPKWKHLPTLKMPLPLFQPYSCREKIRLGAFLTSPKAWCFGQEKTR